MSQHGRHAGPPARRPRWFHGGMVLLGIIGVLVAVVETTYSSSGPSAAAPLRQPTVAPVATVRAAPAPKKKPVKKVIGAHHFIADLTLPYGRVAYDYLKDR